MGQRTLQFLRIFSKRDRRSNPPSEQLSSSSPSPHRARSIDSNYPIPFHNPHHPTHHRAHHLDELPDESTPFVSIPPPPHSVTQLPPLARDKPRNDLRPPLSPERAERRRTSKRIAFGRSNSISSASHSTSAILSPPSPASAASTSNAYSVPTLANRHQQPPTWNTSPDPYVVRQIPSLSSDIGDDISAPASAPLDHFVPYRPPQRDTRPYPAAVPDFRVSTTTPDVSSLDSDRRREAPSTAYSKKPTTTSRFVLRRRNAQHSHNASRAAQQNIPSDPAAEQNIYFGATQHDERERASEIRPGEEVLIRFIRNTLGPKAQNFAVRLMNKTPITSTTSFTYVIHQETEDSDIDIIRRDLTAGRLYSSGVRLIGGAWCNLLLGDRFAPGSSTRQRHELTYRRSSCSCITCRVRVVELAQAHAAENGSHSGFESDMDTTTASADMLSSMSSTGRTPVHSAMANFVVKYKLPDNNALMSIGASASSRELEIGTVVRLNYRASAKLKFTDDVRELFGHLAYTGPISHEEVYRRVTTIGVHYYLYNKGKKERKVYIQGELIRLPVQVGVIKLGTQPMYLPELGATFCLYRKQIMSIYVGEIVLEGNSIGSFIKTGIRYYIGFGEERGVCPVYPNKTLGKARKLGINELLLHHHMVDDLEVKCV